MNFNLWQWSGLTLLSMVAAVLFTSARSILLPLPLVVMTLDYFGAFYVALYVRPKKPVLLGVIAVGFAPLAYFVTHTNNNLWPNCALALLLTLSFLLMLNRDRPTTR